MWGVPANDSNPGVLIGYIYEKHLQMLWYYTYHCQQVESPVMAMSTTLAHLTTLYHSKEPEQEHEYENEIEMPEKLTSVENICIV